MLMINFELSSDPKKPGIYFELRLQIAHIIGTYRNDNKYYEFEDKMNPEKKQILVIII